MIPVVRRGRKSKYPEINQMAETEQPHVFRVKKDAMAFRTAVYRKGLTPVMQFERGVYNIWVRKG